MVEEGEGEPDRVDALLDQVPVLAGPRSVADLPGGLTNRNLRVTTSTGDYVVRLTQSDAGLLGIDRDAEHANSRAAAEAGVGAEVVDYRPDLGMLVITFLPGHRAHQRDHREAPVSSRGPPTRSGGSRRARGSSTTSTCSRGRRGTSALVREHGFDAAPRRTTVSRRSGNAYGARWRARPAATVPCNNDLLAGNFIDDGQQVWLIDYEYSGNNDPAFELGNTATECDLTREQTDELVASWAGHEPDPAFRARVDLQSLCSEYGWALWGFIQAATSPIDFDFHGWGMERFEKAARRFTSDGFDGSSTGCGGSTASGSALDHRHRWLSKARQRLSRSHRCPERAQVVIIGGGVIGCSTAYHLAKLGWTDVRAARAGHAVVRHDLARRRAGRAAAGERERHQAGAVLHRALRGPRGRDGPVDRLPPVRRPDRRPHRGPDGPAAAHGRHRRGIRPRLRDAHTRAGAGEVAGHRDRRPARRDLAAAGRPRQPDRPDARPGQGRAIGRRPRSTSRSG